MTSQQQQQQQQRQQDVRRSQPLAPEPLRNVTGFDKAAAAVISARHLTKSVAYRAVHSQGTEAAASDRRANVNSATEQTRIGVLIANDPELDDCNKDMLSAAWGAVCGHVHHGQDNTLSTGMTQSQLWQVQHEFHGHFKRIQATLERLVPDARKAALQPSNDRRGSRGVTYEHAAGMVLGSRQFLERVVYRNGSGEDPNTSFAQLIDADVGLDAAMKGYAKAIWRRLSGRLNIEQCSALCEGMSGAELYEAYCKANGDWQWLRENLGHLLPARSSAGRTWAPSRGPCCA